MSDIRRRFPDAPYALVASADRHRILSEVLDVITNRYDTDMILNPDDEDRWLRQLDQILFEEDLSVSAGSPTANKRPANNAGPAIVRTAGFFQPLQEVVERAWHSSTVQAVTTAIQAVPDWFTSSVRGPNAEFPTSSGSVRADHKLYRLRLDRLDSGDKALVNITGKRLIPDLSLELIIRPDFTEFDSDGDDAITGNPWPRLRKGDQFAAPVPSTRNTKPENKTGSSFIVSNVFVLF